MYQIPQLFHIFNTLLQLLFSMLYSLGSPAIHIAVYFYLLQTHLYLNLESSNSLTHNSLSLTFSI